MEIIRTLKKSDIKCPNVTPVQDVIDRLRQFKDLTSNAISIAGCIQLYEESLKKGNLKKYGAGYNRLEQLKGRYSRGERYFARAKK
jgi:hypothetical protein